MSQEMPPKIMWRRETDRAGRAVNRQAAHCFSICLGQYPCGQSSEGKRARISNEGVEFTAKLIPCGLAFADRHVLRNHTPLPVRVCGRNRVCLTAYNRNLPTSLFHRSCLSGSAGGLSVAGSPGSGPGDSNSSYFGKKLPVAGVFNQQRTFPLPMVR